MKPKTLDPVNWRICERGRTAACPVNRPGHNVWSCRTLRYKEVRHGPKEKRRKPFVYNVLRLQAPRVGLEPTTFRLTAGCSTIELSRNFMVRLSAGVSESNARDRTVKQAGGVLAKISS